MFIVGKLISTSKRKRFFYKTLLIVFISLLSNAQVSVSSRKFLMGLMIGTLLARNGMQTPMYSSPPQMVSYPSGGGGGGQQQPLFIIIPSQSSHGKSYSSSYKPHILRAMSSLDNRDYTDQQLAGQTLVRVRSAGPRGKKSGRMKGLLNRISREEESFSGKLATIQQQQQQQNSAASSASVQLIEADSLDANGSKAEGLK